MKILKNEEVLIDKWEHFLSKSEFSSPFQTPEFFNLFNSVEGYSSDVFAVELDAEYKCLIVVTVLKEKGIKSLFSLRGVVYAGPIIDKEENGYLNFLLKKVNENYKNKLIYLEIRNHFDYSSLLSAFEDNGYQYNKHLNVQLSVENSTLDEILGGMNATKRRQIRQSFKENAVAREAKNEEEVAALFEILKEMYLEKVKLPLFPYKLFLNLYKSDIGKVFVAIHNNKVIGGAFCVYYPNTSMNTFYYTDIRNYHKKIYPSHIALLSAIDFSINNKLKLIDFMGAGKPDTEYGVRDYKLRFGGKLVEDGRFIKIFKPITFELGKIGLSILQKLK